MNELNGERALAEPEAKTPQWKHKRQERGCAAPTETIPNNVHTNELETPLSFASIIHCLALQKMQHYNEAITGNITGSKMITGENSGSICFFNPWSLCIRISIPAIRWLVWATTSPLEVTEEKPTLLSEVSVWDWILLFFGHSLQKDMKEIFKLPEGLPCPLWTYPRPCFGCPTFWN